MLVLPENLHTQRQASSPSLTEDSHENNVLYHSSCITSSVQNRGEQQAECAPVTQGLQPVCRGRVKRVWTEGRGTHLHCILGCPFALLYDRNKFIGGKWHKRRAQRHPLGTMRISGVCHHPTLPQFHDLRGQTSILDENPPVTTSERSDQHLGISCICVSK